MSVWRQKAIECAQELKSEFERADLTPYSVFMELLPITRRAHIDKNNDQLEKIYSYADWCIHQKDEKLWNAAGVSFYEHLCDYEETFSGFTIWIKKEVYTEIRGLLYHRLDDDKMKLLDEHYGINNHKLKNNNRENCFSETAC